MQEIYKNFLIPTEIRFDNLGLNTYRVTLEPFERGFGHTIGNALRRILISSMPGAAICSAQINGVMHEFSSQKALRKTWLSCL